MEKPGKEQKQKPIKDGYYDNIADTIRYAVMLFYVPASQNQEVDFDFNTPIPLAEDQNSWAWMDRVGRVQ